MRTVLAVLLAAVVVVVGRGPSSSVASLALAQEGPPELGAAVLEDPLTATRSMRAGGCPTGRNTTDFVPEGYRLRVTGRCTEAATNASQLVFVRGLTFGDGEVAVEAAAAEGDAQQRVSLHIRVQDNGDGYLLAWDPVRGRAELRKNAERTSVVLAERDGLPPATDGAWARLALRVEGERLWASVGAETIGPATDGAFGTGRVGVGVSRAGNPDDDAPVASVLRNLRATALAQGDVARAPTYEPPAATAGAPSFVPPAGTPPGAGAVVLEHPLTAAGPLPTVECPTGRGGSRVTDEGFLITVRGRCADQLQTAMIAPPVLGLAVGDGEVSVDFKVNDGSDRAVLAITARLQNVRANAMPTGAYAFGIAPDRGIALILRSQDGQNTVLAQRRDVGRLLRPDDWNTLSVRMLGDSLWLIINGQPALSIQDDTFAAGAVGMEVDRLGDPNDEEEVSVAFRNLRVAAIEGAPEDRAPRYTPARPPSVQAVAAPAR